MTPFRPDSALLTDLYQLTMLQGYFEQGMEETAVFEFFVRRLPEERNFLIAAGLAQALEYLEGLHFEAQELEWIARSGRFTTAFVDYLAGLRFTGDVDAMPEGRVFFPNEPILRVVAPLPQAQLVESRLINILHFQTLIASKAARSVLTAPDKLLVDFGLRRAHGAEAGLMAARASYLAGFAGTATTLAAPLFGIPVFGTMAHSFIEAHADEASAFEHFARAQPQNAVLLIDTYDTLAGAERVVAIAPKLRERGIEIKGVRIDSGDLAANARRVRQILDDGGLQSTTIFASGSLDEYVVKTLLASHAPIDGFGIGTHLDTSADAPYLDCAYKLQEYAGEPRRKRSPGKATWPGRKQVYRSYNDDGTFSGDLLALEHESVEGEALLGPAMRQGRPLEPRPSLEDARRRAGAELRRLPAELQRLETTDPYSVKITTALQELADTLDRKHRGESLD